MDQWENKKTPSKVPEYNENFGIKLNVEFRGNS